MKKYLSSLLCCLVLLVGMARIYGELEDLAPGTTVMEYLQGPGQLKEIGINEGPGTFKELGVVLFETNLDVGLGKRSLTGSSNYTLFAPTDAAFRQFGRIGLLRSPSPANPDPNKQKDYIKFAQYHLCSERISAKEIRNRLDRGTRVQTMSGLVDPQELGQILYSVELLNGTVHVIEKVLIHPDLKDFLRAK